MYGPDRRIATDRGRELDLPRLRLRRHIDGMSDPFAELSLALGDRYRIERELGAGGMATVYLAEDLKHNRMVAVKVLKPELAVAIGAARFLAEIKTTANLQHPHILALHDSGEVNGTVFYVMPYVEGESLRDRLEREKQLPVEDALRIAAEVADALQYAHERGVIHRDIKPENILLQRGHAVVADFGIALAASKTGGARMTETGMSLGTPTYMSPEQAMGAREVDARTDVYSLGCVLYEMLVGEPPFVGPTAQSIVAKVMTESPRSLTGQRRTVPPHVDAAVQKSLEKLAADRFASAAAFAESLRDGGQSLRASGHEPVLALLRPRSLANRMARWAAMLVAGVAIAASAFVAGRRSGDDRASTGLSMEQRTFRTLAIYSARYTADGESIVYSAADVGDSPRIYTVTAAYPQPRVVSDSGIHLLAVSSKDELAVLVGAQYQQHRVFVGTLARMPIGGGSPRELVRGVRDADWSRDGSELAIVRVVGGRDRLEYPIGTSLYETQGYLSDLRIAPDGRHIAFNEHPEKGDDRGFVAVVDLKGKHVALTEEYPTIEGLAWSADGRSIVFGAQPAASTSVQQLETVTLDGKIRRDAPGVGDETIQDIAADGRQLILRADGFSGIWLHRAGAASPTDMSWLNLSFFPILSHDGSQLVFGDGSNVAGNTYATMLRHTDGTAAVRLGEGAPLSLSRDQQWVLSEVPTQPVRLMAYPTGVGTSRRLDHGEFVAISAGSFIGDGKTFVICGNTLKGTSGCYTGSTDGGVMHPFFTGSVQSLAVAPDGSFMVANVADSGYRQVLFRDGSARPVPGLVASDEVLRFSPDGRELWTRNPNELPARVQRVDIGTGARSALLPTFDFPSPALTGVQEVSLADDPRTYAYIDRRVAGYLFERSSQR